MICFLINIFNLRTEMGVVVFLGGGFDGKMSQKLAGGMLSSRLTVLCREFLKASSSPG